jgi:MraZ protein
LVSALRSDGFFGGENVGAVFRPGFMRACATASGKYFLGRVAHSERADVCRGALARGKKKFQKNVIRA